MTYGEIRAMLARCDPKQLREDAGISVRTVARALTLPPSYVYRWEALREIPYSFAGLRWLKFVRGLERHAMATAELAATERLAA